MSHRRKGNGHNGHGRVIQGDLIEFDMVALAGADPYEGSCGRCAKQGRCDRGEEVAAMVARMREKAVAEGRIPGEMISGCDEFESKAIDTK